MKKLLLSCLLSALCLTTVFAATYSGSCGENVYWSFDSSTKVLSIYGQGEMYDYSSDGTATNSPWWNYRDSIESINFASGVLTIGKLAFASCKNVLTVNFPDSLERIEKYAFSGCQKLSSVTIGDNVSFIGDCAFKNCNSLISLTCTATIPPTLESTSEPHISYHGEEYWQFISEIIKNLTINVPCASLESYRNAHWDELVTYKESYNHSYKSSREATLQGYGSCDEPPVPQVYTVTVSSANSAMGTVSGGGQYEEGTSVIITAIPKSGYIFAYWSDGTEQNPYTITVNSDINITAYFGTDDSNKYNVSVLPANSTMGRAFFHEVFSTEELNNGQYVLGTNLIAEAIPNSGYKFKAWNDGNNANPYGITVTRDISLLAIFEPVSSSTTYTVSVSSDDTSMGTVSGEGQYEDGQTATVTATPKSGYRFTRWSDGSTANPYSFTVTTNVSLIAFFDDENTTPSRTITCTEAAQIASSLSHNSPTSEIYVVIGYITETDGVISRNQQTFWMADTKDGGKVFESYWGNVSEILQVGDKVSLIGHIMRFYSTPEMTNGDVVLLERPSTPQPESSTFWNFSDAAFNSLGTISSNKTINGLTIYATSSKNVVIDGSNQEIDGLSFTHRLKLNGTGSSDARLLSFHVDGKCDIDVYLKSGSGSEDRTLNIDKGSFGSSLTTIPALSASISKGTIHYTGGATTIYLYSSSGGVNIYAIRVTSENTPQPTTYTVSVSSANSSMGTVSGGGTYEEGATATVTASPKSGYKFTRWSNGSTVNPYSFTVTSNVSLTAYFEQSSTPEPASSKFWNISDGAFNSLGTITSTKTVDGLTIYATSSKNVVIDGSNQEIDGLSFTHRLKLNGTGSSDARLLSFHVDGKCDIDVYLKSGSGSEDRTINVDKGSFGSSLTTIPALSASISKGTIHYTGGATTIYLYSPSSGVNVYAIRVTTGGGSEDIENTYYQEERAQKILRNGQILIIRGDHTYTLQGQEVK